MVAEDLEVWEKEVRDLEALVMGALAATGWVGLGPLA